MKTKILIILICLIVLAGAGGVYWRQKGGTKPIANSTSTPVVERQFPGWCPGMLGLAVSPDGKTAYISFSLDDALLAVDLSTLTITDSIDVSAAGNMMLQSESAVLTPDGKKLYVSNFGTGNVMVIDTENKRVIKVLPIKPAPGVAITMSLDGSKAYISANDGAIYIINIVDDSYRRIFIPSVIFGPVAPSPGNPDLLYVVGALIQPSGISQSSLFTFNISSKNIVRFSKLSDEALPPRVVVHRLVVNSNEDTAYFGWFEFRNPAIGNFSVFDLNNFQVLTTTPIEYGVADFTMNERTGKIYIVGMWTGGSASQKLVIQEWDTATNKVARRIPVSPSSDQRAIVFDPTNDNYLYMTECDFNLIRKVEISTGKEIGKVKFNKADIAPYAIVHGDNNTGYINCENCKKFYRLDLSSGQLETSVNLSFSYSAWGFYQGKLYFGVGGDIYSTNPSNGKVIKKYRIGNNFNPKTFTFFDGKMAAIDNKEGGMVEKQLVLFDARTISILKSIELPRETHGDKVIVSPDGSKIYVEYGENFGAAAIDIYDASTLDIINTIKIPYVPPSQGSSGGATGFVKGEFDETNRIFYLVGFASVYKIDMDTDKLISILDLMDLYESQNIRGWSPFGLAGIAFSPAKDKLFVVSGDAHAVYIYDLIKSSWINKIINLKGYFTTDAIKSPDGRYLYTVNHESDSVTMIDLTSGEIVKIIELP